MAQIPGAESWGGPVNPNLENMDAHGLRWQPISSLQDTQRGYLYHSHPEMCVHLLTPEEAHVEASRSSNSAARVARLDFSERRLRIWLIMGRRYNVRTGEWHCLWWSCDVQQVYIVE